MQSDRDDGLEEPRQFRLTRNGQQWGREHTEELATPTTRTETQETAHEAKNAREREELGTELPVERQSDGG